MMAEMMLRAKRIFSLVIKEMLTLFRDPKGRFVLISPPLVQLFLFAYAATLDVKNVSMAIYNEDRGFHSQQIINRIIGSSTFSHITFINKESSIKPMIDEQKVMLVLHFPADFSRKIEARAQTRVALLLDGRRSNAAQIVNGYLADIINEYDLKLQSESGNTQGILNIIDRNWFNQNLLYMWYTIPALVAILSMLISLVITSLSVARERELGTFEQLLVSPLSPYEILIGKTIPAIIIGMFEGGIIWAAGYFYFQVPFTGSFWLMLFVLFAFILSTVGIGLFISAVSKTQQQAILGAFIFMIPAISLSGYASPVENMPVWLQYATEMNPMKHMLISVKGLFLKDMSFGLIWQNTWPLFIIALITLPIAGWTFSKRKE